MDENKPAAGSENIEGQGNGSLAQAWVKSDIKMAEIKNCTKAKDTMGAWMAVAMGAEIEKRFPTGTY